MRATKLRGGAEDSFTPMGAYFERLASKLAEANAEAAARQHTLDEEDRRLEARYRRASAARAYAPIMEAAL
ncbi:MAG TPA: hypothetical protein PLS69_00895 [Terricaulis sp.]|nr:hypothetical protein [Terricaulis sp.]